MVRMWTLVLLGLALASTRGFALIETLDDGDVARALAVANTSEASRAQFHASYIVRIDDPLVEQLDVITEFRRFVLTAEEEVAAGNWMMARGGYDAKGRSIRDRLRSTTGHVTIRARLRFHPQNVYVTPPAFDIRLGEPPLLALATSSVPDVTAAADRTGRDIINGITVTASFNAPTITDRVLPVRLLSNGQEAARGVVDFSRFE